MSEKKRKKEERKGEAERSSRNRCNSICVFGESEAGKDFEFRAAACELGHVLAERKINFVYGGGIQGLRGNAAISATLNGSQILSVRVKELHDHIFTLGHDLQVSNLPAQMAYMFYHARAFIALPGGVETLEGLASIAYWAKLNYHKKPLVLFNINGFYDGLLSFLDHAVEKRFITQATRHTIMSASTVEEVMDKLQNYTPQPVTSGESSDSMPKQIPDINLRL